MENIHIWERDGHGVAPFRCVGIAEIPSAALAEANPTAYNNAMRLLPTGYRIGTCGVCGMALRINFLIESADGRKFAVGCECVQKRGDKAMVKTVDALVRARNKEIREAKKRAIAEAKLQAERDANGGLTAHEAWEKKREKIAAKEARTRAAVAAIVEPLAAALIDGRRGFRDSVAEDMRKGRLPSGRGRALVIEIVAKTAGRKGSQAFEAKAAEIDRLLAKAEKRNAR